MWQTNSPVVVMLSYILIFFNIGYCTFYNTVSCLGHCACLVPIAVSQVPDIIYNANLVIDFAFQFIDFAFQLVLNRLVAIQLDFKQSKISGHISLYFSL